MDEPRLEERIEQLEQRLRSLEGAGLDLRRLTSTEARVAALAARGRSNHEIADTLALSPKTVEWNLTKVYRKLHVRSRAELAAKAARPAKSGHTPRAPGLTEGET
jgi:DNA-binding NarL/FixJ family response regulator